MHIGMLFTFTLPEGSAPTYVADLVSRWRTVATFSQPFNLLREGMVLVRWRTLPDRAIDLDRHLRHWTVPPGGETEVTDVVSRLHSERLDRSRPLWECHVFEGAVEGRWSFYLKVHHSQLDGVVGLRMAKRIFSTDPRAQDMLPPWAVGLRGPDQSGLPRLPRLPRAELGDPRGRRSRAWATARAMAGSLGATYAETLLGASERARAVPYRAPRTMLNRRITADRRFATQRYRLDRLRALAAAAEASLNDVYLSVCGGALRRYLVERGALPSTSLTGIVPVAVPQPDASRVGTAITFAYAALGTDIADPVRRLRAVTESTRLAKARVPPAQDLAMDTFTTALMLPFLGEAVLGVGGFARPAFNAIVSNVPGFTEERFLDGSLLEEYYPISLLFQGQGLNITAVSNATAFCIGFTGCPDVVPELERLADHAGAALGELEATLGLGPVPAAIA